MFSLVFVFISLSLHDLILPIQFEIIFVYIIQIEFVFQFVLHMLQVDLLIAVYFLLHL